MRVFDASWFYWAVGVAVGLPVGMILLTEWHHVLLRRHSKLARSVSMLRTYLLPLSALWLLLVNVAQVSTTDTAARGIATLFAFVVLLLLLSGLKATLFQSAPDGTWRRRVPAIFLDVTRFLLIGVGLALILSGVWGTNIGKLFTALGVTSVVLGLMLQNSVGQIASGLFMLFEQPFRTGDWLDTPAARGRVVEANWRAVHIHTGNGLQITPNSVLATTSFTNLSRTGGTHKLEITTKFSTADPPDRVCAMLSRVAGELPQLKADATADSVVLGAGEYRTTVTLNSPADDSTAQATFLRWIWYAARRAELHLDGADDDFSAPQRVEAALGAVVVPLLRLNPTDHHALIPHTRLVRYGAGEIVQQIGEVPTVVTFLISGTVRLTTTDQAGAAVPMSTLNSGSFLGLSALTRQPVITGGYALDEVTALEVDRAPLERLAMSTPALLQDLGRLIDERRSKARQVTVPEG